jgi:hypothetical protein
MAYGISACRSCSCQVASPDIRGRVINVFWENPRGAWGQYRPSANRYYVKLELVNHSDASCTISNYRMCLSTGGDDGQLWGDGKDFIVGKIKHTSTFIDKFTSVNPVDGSSETGIFGSKIGQEFPSLEDQRLRSGFNLTSLGTPQSLSWTGLTASKNVSKFRY